LPVDDDTGAEIEPFLQIKVRIDNGAFTQYRLTPDNSTITVASGYDDRKHLLEVIVKSTSERVDRWAKQQNGVTFTGLQFDSGATVTAPIRKPYNVLLCGDSITEGIVVNRYSGSQDTDCNDVTRDYSWVLSQMLPIEVGVVGFGSTGITKSGSGGAHLYLPPINFFGPASNGHSPIRPWA
jgi:hypothetical protein